MAGFFNNHKKYEDLLTEYLDGRLDAKAKARFRAHLEACERCAAALREMEAVTAILRAESMVEPPRSFALPLNAGAPSPAAQPRSFLNTLLWAGSGSFAMLRSLQLATATAALVLVALVSLNLAGVGAVHGTATNTPPGPSAALNTRAGGGIPVPTAQSGAAPQAAATPTPTTAGAASGSGQPRSLAATPDTGITTYAQPSPEPPGQQQGGSQPKNQTSATQTSSPVLVPPATPVAAATAGRSALEWAQTAFSALTAALALSVVGIAWVVYRRPG